MSRMIELQTEHGRMAVDAFAIWSISRESIGRCWISLKEWNGLCKNFIANESYDAVKRKVEKACGKID